MVEATIARRSGAGICAFVLATAWLAPARSDAAAERGEAAEGCSILQVQNAHHTSVLRRIEAPSGRATHLATVDFEINAIGYARDQDLSYGVAQIRHRPHLISLDRRGRVVDLGALRGHGLFDPTAGAVLGQRLYLRDGHRLFTVDIDPRSRSFREVREVAWLSPGLLVHSVDDFAADPATGLLYGLTTVGFGPAQLVSLDPRSGKLRAIASLPGLPRRHSYTSVVIGGSRLYAVHTAGGERSRFFEIRLDRTKSARELASWSSARGGDAAGCLRAAAPPPPPPPPPPTPTPRPTPTPTPRPTPTQRPTPTPRPTATPRPTPPPTSTPRPTTPPVPTVPPTRPTRRPTTPPPSTAPPRTATPRPTGSARPPVIPPVLPPVIPPVSPSLSPRPLPPSPSPSPTPTRSPSPTPAPGTSPPWSPKYDARAAAADAEELPPHLVRDQRRWSTAVIVLVFLSAAATLRLRRYRRPFN
ncbi:DUF6923 family protein [Kribbella deserti]|uniref:DUF6923 family protein n=1 Tax=Kribbella deserti TaxID=1926257 RepID=A0ABV6QXJ0_9ACTN